MVVRFDERNKTKQNKMKRNIMGAKFYELRNSSLSCMRWAVVIFYHAWYHNSREIFSHSRMRFISFYRNWFIFILFRLICPSLEQYRVAQITEYLQWRKWKLNLRNRTEFGFYFRRMSQERIDKNRSLLCVMNDFYIFFVLSLKSVNVNHDFF